jgi:hypothetical protein
VLVWVQVKVRATVQVLLLARTLKQLVKVREQEQLVQRLQLQL